MCDIELDNDTILNQSTQLVEAGIPDNKEASISAQAKELLEPTSNEDTLNTAEIETVQNSATQPEGRGTAHNHDPIHAEAVTLDSRIATTRPDTGNNLTSDNRRH